MEALQRTGNQPGAQAHSVPLPQPLSSQPVPPSLPRSRWQQGNAPGCPHLTSHRLWLLQSF